MRIGVVGMGYVGLVTSACLAQWGHEVVGVDVDVQRLRSLKEKRVPFYEPGLAELVASNYAAGRLRFESDLARLAAGAELVVIAVGTHDGNGGWQTESIRACLASLVPLLQDHATLVIRSTLPPEFIRALPLLVQKLREESGRPMIPILLNPEFTREGNAVRDFMQPERVVLGVVEDPLGRGVELLQDLYRDANAPVFVLTAIDAAFAKLGSNLFLATKISFANELANLCDLYGATVDRVVEAMALDPRIGGQFLRAGVGFGGSCLPHQVTMTVRAAELLGVNPPLLIAVDNINHGQRVRFVELLAEMVGGDLEDKRIALLGLTFKPHTDDLRDAPSLSIAALLLERGARVCAYDPMAGARDRALATLPALETADTVTEAVAGAHAAGLVTEWPEFNNLDWAALGRSMAQAALVDGRNALSPEVLTRAGFRYRAFGRGYKSPDGEARQRAFETAASRAQIQPSAAG